MGDLGDIYNDMREERRNLRVALGIPCPVCKEKLPKAHPKILLPGAYCKMHKYRDPRDPSMTEDFRTFKETKR